MKKTYQRDGRTVEVEIPDTAILCWRCHMPSEWNELVAIPSTKQYFRRVKMPFVKDGVNEDGKKLYAHQVCRNKGVLLE
jgi:hypothetical protein